MESFKKTKDLNTNQKIFIAEYLKTRNATQAAKVAGYSEKSAHVQGHDLLNNPKIRRYLLKLLGDLNDKYEISAERTLRELAAVAYSTMDDVAKWNESGVTVKDSDELSEPAAASVCEVSESATQFGQQIKIKQHNKVAALKVLAEYQGLIGKKIEIGLDKDTKKVIKLAYNIKEKEDGSEEE